MLSFTVRMKSWIEIRFVIVGMLWLLFTPDQYFVRIVGVDIDPIQIQEAKLEASKRFYLYKMLLMYHL